MDPHAHMSDVAAPVPAAPAYPHSTALPSNAGSLDSAAKAAPGGSGAPVHSSLSTSTTGMPSVSNALSASSSLATSAPTAALSTATAASAPSLSSSAPAPSMSSGTGAVVTAADAARHAQWAEWVARLSDTASVSVEVRCRVLDELNHVCASVKCANYLLTKLRLLDRLFPLLVSAAGSQSQQRMPEYGVLDRCLHLVSACAWQAWEDRAKSELISGYPGLVERLAYVYTRNTKPETQAHAARALWNLAWKNESLRTHAIVQQVMLAPVVANLSSKHMLLRKMSMGFLWALCEGHTAGAKQCTAAVIEKHEGLRTVLQGLNSNDAAASAGADSETYFLLLSLLLSLLNQHHPAGRQAKQQACSMQAASILLPLLARTTSTTLMDRICEVLTAVLFNQPKEMVAFASANGLRALAAALQNPMLAKCQLRILMAILAALYRNPLWGAGHLTSTDAAHALTGHVQPVFEFLAQKFGEVQQQQSCQLPNLAMGLCLATIVQGRPALAEALVQRPGQWALQGFARLLTPPAGFPPGDRATILQLGLVQLLQIAQHSPAVQSFLVHQNFAPAPAANTAPGANGAPSQSPAAQPTPVVPPSAQGVYGSIFQAVLNCVRVPTSSATSPSIQPVQTARLVSCLLERERGVGNLLLSGHEGFLNHILDALKYAYPSRINPTMRDDGPLVHLGGCLFVLCGGPAVAGGSASKLPEQPEVQVNFQRLTQRLYEANDSKILDALAKIHKQVLQHQQQTAALQAQINSQAHAQTVLAQPNQPPQQQQSHHPPSSAPTAPLSGSSVLTVTNNTSSGGGGSGSASSITNALVNGMQNLKPLPPSMPPMQQNMMQGNNSGSNNPALYPSPQPPSVAGSSRVPQLSPSAAAAAAAAAAYGLPLGAMNLAAAAAAQMPGLAQHYLAHVGIGGGHHTPTPSPPPPSSSPRPLTDTEMLTLVYTQKFLQATQQQQQQQRR